MALLKDRIEWESIGFSPGFRSVSEYKSNPYPLFGLGAEQGSDDAITRFFSGPGIISVGWLAAAGLAALAVMDALKPQIVVTRRRRRGG